MRLVTCIRPRPAYQVIRYGDGPRIMLTCTRRGRVRVAELYVTQLKSGAWVEKHRYLEGADASDALNRAVAAGYNPIAIAEDLKRAARAA